jgi:hypothetical protein
MNYRDERVTKQLDTEKRLMVKHASKHVLNNEEMP